MAAPARMSGVNQVYSIAGSISLPIYTGGRIHVDIEQAQADLNRRQAEYEDGRVAYDVRIAWLSLSASDSTRRSRFAASRWRNGRLWNRKDRYTSGVTNFLEVVQAQEAVTAASENYIEPFLIQRGDDFFCSRYWRRGGKAR